MKRETLRHPKLYELMARLNCSRVAALGHLTLLWDFTKDSAPRGDIGKWTDGAIAHSSDWTGDASEFVEALIAARWLDRHELHRLIVHDWKDHAEAWVRAKLAKSGEDFVEPNSLTPLLKSTSVGQQEASYPPTINLTEPNLTKPLRPEEVDFSILEESDLRSPRKLLIWIRDNWPPDEVTEAHVLNIFGAAAKSLSEGNKPVGMFVSIVKRGKWRSVNKSQQKQARENLASITVTPSPQSNNGQK